MRTTVGGERRFGARSGLLSRLAIARLPPLTLLRNLCDRPMILLLVSRPGAADSLPDARLKNV